MTIASRTPEGESNRCSFCGKQSSLEPSITAWDAPCPHCGWLMWYESPPQLELFDRWLGRFRELKATGRLRFNLPRALLDCVQEATDAPAAAVWFVQDEEVRHVVWDCIPACCTSAKNRECHSKLLRKAAAEPGIMIVPPTGIRPRPNGNPSDYLAILQRFCRSTDVLVLELFFPRDMSRGEQMFVRTLLESLEEIVSGSSPVIEPGIDFAPPSSVDPPVKLSPIRLPRDSWWKRLLSALQPHRAKSLA